MMLFDRLNSSVLHLIGTPLDQSEVCFATQETANRAFVKYPLKDLRDDPDAFWGYLNLITITLKHERNCLASPIVVKNEVLQKKHQRCISLGAS